MFSWLWRRRKAEVPEVEAVPLQPQPPPNPDIDADPVIAFVSIHLQRKRGVRARWDVLYENFSDWWAEGPGDTKPLSAAEFGAALRFVCERANPPIAVEMKRGRPYCVGVRLIDPNRRAQKALPAPKENQPSC